MSITGEKVGRGLTTLVSQIKKTQINKSFEAINVFNFIYSFYWITDKQISWYLM